MIIANTRGKKGAEDQLTSSMFSAFNYFGSEFLSRFLSQAKNLDGKTLRVSGKHWEFNFWPTLYINDQRVQGNIVVPDLVLRSEEQVIVVEAKDYSGKSGSGIHFGPGGDRQAIDQLAKQFATAKSHYKMRGSKFILLYLTRDVTSPRAELEESLRAVKEALPDLKGSFRPQLYWINWQASIPIFKELADSQKLWQASIAKDIMAFFSSRRISRYDEFHFLKKASPISFAQFNQFYDVSGEKYWIPQLTKLSKTSKTLFYEN